MRVNFISGISRGCPDDASPTFMGDFVLFYDVYSGHGIAVRRHRSIMHGNHWSMATSARPALEGMYPHHKFVLNRREPVKIRIRTRRTGNRGWEMVSLNWFHLVVPRFWDFTLSSILREPDLQSRDNMNMNDWLPDLLVVTVNSRLNFHLLYFGSDWFGQGIWLFSKYGVVDTWAFVLFNWN